MIIVEGPDGAGKTTIIQNLEDDLGLPISPRVVGTDTVAMVNLKLWTEDNLNKGFQNMLFDRHRLISEPIYGAVKHRTDPGFDDPAWMVAMMSEFYHIRPIIIYCLPPKALVLKNVNIGPTDNSAVVKITDWVYNAYVARAAIDIFNLESCFIYDYTRHDYVDLLENIERELTKHEL